MDAYIGMIIMFAGPYAPDGWMFCDGRVLNIAQYQALFAVIGATYGGNGTTTFALPDLRGRVPLAPGQGPGLGNYALGQATGGETVALSLSAAQMPAHTHTFAQPANKSRATTSSPENAVSGPNPSSVYSATSDCQMLAGTTGNAGGGSPVPVRVVQPVLPVNFLMCVNGLFPPRS